MVNNFNLLRSKLTFEELVEAHLDLSSNKLRGAHRWKTKSGFCSYIDYVDFQEIQQFGNFGKDLNMIIRIDLISSTQKNEAMLKCAMFGIVEDDVQEDSSIDDKCKRKKQ